MALSVLGFVAARTQLLRSGFQFARIYRFGTTPDNSGVFESAFNAFKTAFESRSKGSIKGAKVGFGYSVREPGKMVAFEMSGPAPELEPQIAEVAAYMGGKGTRVWGGKGHTVGNCVEYRVANRLEAMGVKPEDMRIYVFSKKTLSPEPPCSACTPFNGNQGF